MNIEIVPYTEEHEAIWDSFCEQALNATFLHTYRFLSYHGDRFKNLSVLIMESGKVVGIFPAAESLIDPSLIISHPGITYGGIVHQGRLTGLRMLDALKALSEYYGLAGYERLEYKAIPFIYPRSPSQDDLYALFQLGAKRTRCDLSSTIDLVNRQKISERRRRGKRKAEKVVTLSSDSELLGDLWNVITQNLASKHDAKPVHSISDIGLIIERFPKEVTIRCALMDNIVEAGIILFNSPVVWHAQYIAASKKAYSVSALDAVFSSVISEAENAGARYFDFGTSNEKSGKILNDGLYRFKCEFGGGGVVHEYYELRLG